jgi:uncharacterized membrane protein
MDYLVAKWLHILSSTILFGAGVGSAFHLFAASRRGGLPAIAAAARTVVLADWLFTLPTAVFQPASGLWLLHLMQVPLSTPWVAWSLALYALAIGCWLPVVVIQLRLRDIAAQALQAGEPQAPPAYWTLWRWWTGLGFAAFFAFLAIFWLMVAKRVPWA